MTVRFALVDVSREAPVSVGEATFLSAPRAGDFIEVQVAGEAGRVEFEVRAVIWEGWPSKGEVPDDDYAGDLYLRRIGSKAAKKRGFGWKARPVAA